MTEKMKARRTQSRQAVFVRCCLYISAHPSKESQAAYRSLGCVEAEEINKAIAENEPFDIQMEYVL